MQALHLQHNAGVAFGQHALWSMVEDLQDDEPEKYARLHEAAFACLKEAAKQCFTEALDDVIEMHFGTHSSIASVFIFVHSEFFAPI